MVKAFDFATRLFHSRHIFETVKPLFIVSYIFGMTPFYLVKDHQKQYILKTSNFGYFLTCTAFASMCLIGMNALLANESVIAYFFRSEITIFVDTIQQVFEMGGVVVIYLQTTRGQFDVLYMMRSIDEVDVLLIKGIGGIQILYRRVLYFVWMLTGTEIAIVIGYTLMNYFLLSNADIFPSLGFYIAFTSLNAIIIIIIGHFICMSTILVRRFQILNLVSLVRKSY